MRLLLQFMVIGLKLYTCLNMRLKLCILFGHNPQIVCFALFYKINLVISAAKMNRY